MVTPLGEGQLRRVLREDGEYYNESRCNMALDGDAPEHRDVEHGDGPVVAAPVLGGLHHRYSRAARVGAQTLDPPVALPVCADRERPALMRRRFAVLTHLEGTHA